MMTRDIGVTKMEKAPACSHPLLYQLVWWHSIGVRQHHACGSYASVSKLGSNTCENQNWLHVYDTPVTLCVLCTQRERD